MCAVVRYPVDWPMEMMPEALETVRGSSFTESGEVYRHFQGACHVNKAYLFQTLWPYTSCDRWPSTPILWSCWFNIDQVFVIPLSFCQHLSLYSNGCSIDH